VRDSAVEQFGTIESVQDRFWLCRVECCQEVVPDLASTKYFRNWGFGFRVQGFVFQDSGFGFQLTGQQRVDKTVATGGRDYTSVPVCPTVARVHLKLVQVCLKLAQVSLQLPRVLSHTGGGGWEGFRESTRCSRDTCPETYITEYILTCEEKRTGQQRRRGE